MAPSRGKIQVSASGRTDRGRVRDENQDSFLLVDLGSGTPNESPQPNDRDAAAFGPISFTLSDDGAIVFVADGVGGRAGGAKASAMAVSTVRDVMLDGAGHSVPTAADFVRRLLRSLDHANAAIHEESRHDAQSTGMGTTATLAGLLGDTIYVAQVGDSRSYLVRASSIGRLTRDQSLVQDLIDSGVLSEDDSHGVPDNMILQAVGTAPTVHPAVTCHELRRGDVVLLCSDGLSGVISDAELGEEIARASDCVALCDVLVDLANERGGPDNITVLAVEIGGEGVEEPGESDTVERSPYDLPPA
jgi:serine/threonine protein phosphatase PrpC